MFNPFKQNTLILALSIQLFASVSWGNFVGNDTNNFNPVPSGLDFITVHGSETLNYGLLNSNAFVNHAANTLPVAFDMITDKPLHFSDKITFTDVSFGFGITERFEVGLTFSTLLDQTTDRTNDGSQFNATGLNEIRALTKYNFIKRNPIGLAVALSANFNESLNSPFAGTNSGPTTNIEAILDYRFDQVLVALNLGYRFRQNGTPILDSIYDPLPDQYIASIATNYYITSADLKLVAEVYSARSAKSTRNITADHISSEWLFGAKYDATSNISIQAGGGSRISKGLFTPDWRAFLGMNVNFEIFERPAAVTSAYVSQVQTQTLKDVSDNEDLAKDSFDDLSQRHEFYLRTSIPETETKDPKTPFEVIRLQNFDFDFASSTIKPEFHTMLDRLARYLSSPDIVKIRIEGHTDSHGRNERNRLVSQARADQVKEYLHKFSALSQLDMEAVGYGADRPIADNGNFQGRKQNRRVEVRIVRRPLSKSE